MVNKTVAVYVFFDDLLKAMNHQEPISRQTTDAEVLTTLLVAAQYFSGNVEKAISFVKGTTLIPRMLSKSRFNLRMHAIGELLALLFVELGQLNITDTYSIDSFPIAVCYNIRIARSRIVRGEAYRGYCAFKRSYFYGFKVHIIATAEGDFGGVLVYSRKHSRP